MRCNRLCSVQHNFPRTYLLVQSRAPSWSRAQVENGSSETRTVRACRRIIKITPSIWLWGEVMLSYYITCSYVTCLRYQCCRQDHLPQLEENDASFWSMVVPAKKAEFLSPRYLVNWFWPIKVSRPTSDTGPVWQDHYILPWKVSRCWTTPVKKLRHIHWAESWKHFSLQDWGCKKGYGFSLLLIHSWIAAVTKPTTSERQQPSKAVSDAPHWYFLLLHLYLTQTDGIRSLVLLLRAPASHSCWSPEPVR